jgi:hypothetical protein
VHGPARSIQNITLSLGELGSNYIIGCTLILSTTYRCKTHTGDRVKRGFLRGVRYTISISSTVFILRRSLSNEPANQCCGSVTFWYGTGCGSESSDPYLCLTDPDADLRSPKEYGSGSGTLIKSQKEVTKQQKSRFFLIFFPEDGRIRSRSRLRTSDYWIRMRFREAQKHRNPTMPPMMSDPEPKY